VIGRKEKAHLFCKIPLFSLFSFSWRLWSSGCDWTLPTSRPGFDSRPPPLFVVFVSLFRDPLFRFRVRRRKVGADIDS
jgi:hypothetical protein